MQSLKAAGSQFCSLWNWGHYELIDYTDLVTEVTDPWILLFKALEMEDINMVFEHASYNGNKNQELVTSWKQYTVPWSKTTDNKDEE